MLLFLLLLWNGSSQRDDAAVAAAVVEWFRATQRNEPAVLWLCWFRSKLLVLQANGVLDFWIWQIVIEVIE